MRFELTNNNGEVVLAAESDCTWHDDGETVYTVGDPNMLTWMLNPEMKDRWPLYLKHAPGMMLYNAFVRSAAHYGLNYTGDQRLTTSGMVMSRGDPDPQWAPARPVYTGKIQSSLEASRNAHLRPVKMREFILETLEGSEIVRARLEAGRWHEMVEVSYDGDVSVLRWSGSPAEPRWVYSFFKDATMDSALILTGPDKEGEPYMLDLPPGWEFV